QYGDSVSCNMTLDGDGATAGRSWPAATTLLVAGRPNGTAYDTSDQLFPITAAGAAAGAAFNPASGPRPGSVYRGNGRLLRDSTGELYQLHATQGLIRISDGTAIVPRQTAALAYAPLGLDVYVGPVQLGDGSVIGRPILDAAFDPRSDATP